MNKVKCGNGHFYNGDKFQSCPICGSEEYFVVGGQSQQVNGKENISSTKPLIPKSAERAKINKSHYGNEIENMQDELKKEKKQVNEIPSVLPVVQKEVETEIEKNEKTENIKVYASGELLQKDNNDNIGINQTLEEGKSDFKKAIEATSSTNITPLPKTIAYYDFDEVVPPVGWLICIKGVYLGTAFECKTGRNKIGRGPDMDVNLLEDASVSRNVQAILIYEPKNRQFFIQPGNSDGLVYLNDNLLFEHEMLSVYDKITISNSEFIFMPLCGEKFSWDDYITEG